METTTPTLSRIMVVEDDPFTQGLLRASLEQAGGYTVEACGAGEEALTRVPSFRPDLILLDVMMPGMDGPALLQALRDDDDMAAIPVIFLTAGGACLDSLKNYKQLGVFDIIHKPFNPSTLPHMVRNIWDYYHS